MFKQYSEFDRIKMAKDRLVMLAVEEQSLIYVVEMESPRLDLWSASDYILHERDSGSLWIKDIHTETVVRAYAPGAWKGFYMKARIAHNGVFDGGWITWTPASEMVRQDKEKNS